MPLGAAFGPLGLASFLIALVAVVAELFARRPADRRAHRGDVAQQEVEVKGREALPAVSGGPVLQLLPSGHADGPSSAPSGEVVVGQVVQHGADGVVLVAARRSWRELV